MSSPSSPAAPFTVPKQHIDSNYPEQRTPFRIAGVQILYDRPLPKPMEDDSWLPEESRILDREWVKRISGSNEMELLYGVFRAFGTIRNQVLTRFDLMDRCCLESVDFGDFGTLSLRYGTLQPSSSACSQTATTPCPPPSNQTTSPAQWSLIPRSGKIK